MNVAKRAIIVDDHPLARMAIRGLLETHGFAIIAEAEEGLKALKILMENTPEIAIIDVDIPGINGVDLVEKLRSRQFSGIIVVVSAKNDRFYGKRSADAGANAFVSKKEGMENIIAAINAAQNGYSYFPFILNSFVGSDTSEHEKLETLSSQETKVLRYILAGYDNSRIGDAMHISSKTVSTYKTRLMEKLGCNSLIELISFANRNKIV
ncbi:MULTISPECIES: acid-sensing system DNA-binding response regulator EvgA [unclassified Serratia (in: enterobacteria)]|uniref:acid-sensing system DNA-binding response regulator EvgA n=1 Tax=unclassified Serratia (in: enterobacteria) TaxID=2647522 RepID=UPI0030763AA6